MAEEKDINFEIVDVDDLIQDDHNFNKGTEEGAALIGRSFAEHGAGRSVFIDKNNRLVGGNKAQKGFKGAGYRKVVIVDSEPDTLIAVRRKDVDLDSKEGREMAMLDNLTIQVNLAWDETEIQTMADEIDGFDPEDFGFEMPKLMEEPTDLDMTDEEQADKEQGLFCKITFKSVAQLQDFISKYQDSIVKEYDASIVIHGGAL